MHPDHFLASFQSTFETANRLRERTGLKSVYIVPAEATDWLGWPTSSQPSDPNRFSQLLGKFASPFVSRNVAAALKMKAFNEFGILNANPEKLRVGIAGGITIHALVDAFQLSDSVATGCCSIMPLVVGPIPETIYSAGFIAEILRKKLNAPADPDAVISELKIDTCIKIEMLDAIVKSRDGQPDKHPSSPLNLDVVITGIGSLHSGQFKADIETTSKDRMTELANRKGDICSRVFGPAADELDSAHRDKFVAITFRWLKHLSAQPGRRVVAVAGGAEKFDALKILLRLSIQDKFESGLSKNSQQSMSGSNPNKQFYRLFNVLITDELSATKLLRELNRQKFVAILEREVLDQARALQSDR